MARGDHIKVSRGAYDHHGIDVGNGEVIHYSGEMNAEKKNAVICSVSKAAFAAGGKVDIVKHDDKCYSRDETVRRAKKHLGEGLGKYDFLGNNCEHFARWCKTGTKESRQVQRVVKGVVGGALARGAAIRLFGASLGPVGAAIAALIGFAVGSSSDKDQTKPDDDTPKVEGEGEMLEGPEDKQ